MAAGAQATQKAGTSTVAAPAGARPSARAAAGMSEAPSNAVSANAARAHAAQEAVRLQARATEAKIAAATARSDRVAKQQRAAALQRNRQAQSAAQTLSRAHSRQGLSPVATAGVTTARFTAGGPTRAQTAGEDPSARGRGVTATSQPGLRVTQTGSAATIAPSSRVSPASGTLGGPHLPLSGRLGGPAQGPAASHSAIDGSQLRRRL